MNNSGYKPQTTQHNVNTTQELSLGLGKTQKCGRVKIVQMYKGFNEFS